MPRHVMSCIYIYICMRILKSLHMMYIPSLRFFFWDVSSPNCSLIFFTMNTFAYFCQARKRAKVGCTRNGNHLVRCYTFLCPMIFPWYSHDIPMNFPWISHDIPMIFPRNWHYLCSPWYSHQTHQTHHHCWWIPPVLPCGDGLINGPWNERTPITSWW